MKRIFKYLLLFLLFISFPIITSAKENINIYLFYSKSCPHCKAEQEFLNNYLSDKDNIKLHKYEISSNEGLFKKAQEKTSIPATGVPYLVIGDSVIQGYMSSTTDKRIISLLNYYETNDYKDILKESIEVDTNNEKVLKTDKNSNYTVPILGNINAKKVSLPILAIIIGFIDGFNPCAMWILLFLITMLFGMKDRKKMWILGFTFLFTSGFIYLLFMLSYLSIANFINEIIYIKMFIAIVALIFGTINIIKFINTKNTGCEVVNDSKRKKIIKSIKGITSNKYFIISLLGIIILAVSVNIIELFCSLGLPVLYTEILSLNNLNRFTYFIYLLIYILFFMIDDIIIFLIAMKTSKITAISNKYTKYSHLVGGIIMLIIGLLMILKPEWLMFNF